MWGHMTGTYGYGMGGGFMMLLFWLIILAAVFIGMKWLMTSNHNERKSSSTALDILESRYAQGEINRDEFEQKRRDLVGK